MAKKGTPAPDLELPVQRARAEHAEIQRDNLAFALRGVLDAHYHWREHGEGKTGAEADEAAQRFIDARGMAGAALSMAPAATAAAAQTINARVLESARQAYSHINQHEHEGVTREDHFFSALMEQLGFSPAASTLKE